jgi:predicted 3-demethylubiquinone-9 3-methyltransferase (glyoxalase superfamily)
MKSRLHITPCLWFDDQAEEAAKYYCDVFPNSKIIDESHYGEAGRDQHGRAPGSVMTVSFELDGRPFTALNGGPHFRFSEAISLQLFCETQAEIDRYWKKLSADPKSEQCGWLKDKYGLSWQVVPAVLPELLRDPKDPGAQRAMEAMLGMKKLEIAALRHAYAGEPAMASR